MYGTLLSLIPDGSELAAAPQRLKNNGLISGGKKGDNVKLTTNIWVARGKYHDQDLHRIGTAVWLP
jgi:hypothetical protein